MPEDGPSSAAGGSAAATDTIEEHKSLLRVDVSQGTVASRHILLPIDDTDDSERAIRWAIDNLYRPGDVFHLLHVIPEPKMVHVWAGVYLPPEDDAETVMVQDAKDFVKHRFARMLVENATPFQLHVVVGPTESDVVARLIARKAADVGAAVVVMARHRKNKMAEWWAGSASKSVIKSAPAPVVLVPPA